MATISDEDFTADIDTDEEGFELEELEDGDIEGTGEDVTEAETTVISPEGDVAPAAEPEEEVDLTEFAVAAQESIESGEYEAVNAEYNKLSRKGRTKAMKLVNDEIKGFLTASYETDAEKETGKTSAFAWGQMQQALKSTPKVKEPKAPREPKAPADPTPVLTDNLAALFVAYETVRDSVSTIDNVSADWATTLASKIEAVKPEVTTLMEYAATLDENRGDEPEVSELAHKIVALAVKGTKIKATRTASGTPRATQVYDGPRRSIKGHIEQAFAGQPSGGYLSVSDIRNFLSSEYPDSSVDGRPSAGAISSAMKSPKWDATVVVPGNGGEKGTFGATKA